MPAWIPPDLGNTDMRVNSSRVFSDVQAQFLPRRISFWLLTRLFPLSADDRRESCTAAQAVRIHAVRAGPRIRHHAEARI
jgi:hypothetical protein